MTVGAIINVLEKYAHPSLQESWDNTGLQVGNRKTDCTGVLVCVDCTPAVVNEAIERGCNLIVSHHPLIFKGVKHLTGSTPVETAIMNAIASGISIYSCHTALDSTVGGVSHEIAKRLGIKPLRVLAPLKDRLVALDVIVPKDHAADMRLALFEAGAGNLGNYEGCSFSVEGTGTFIARDGADPYVGEINVPHTEDEVNIHVVLERCNLAKVEQALLEAHPYETPAYSFTPMLNVQHNIGLGIYGIVEEPADGITLIELINRVKEVCDSPFVRTTATVESAQETRIKRVALCGGSGGEFIDTAIAVGAQAYITSDVRYHDFVDYKNAISIIDIGHFESEQCTKDIFYRIIKEKFANFAVYKSDTEKNSINYI